MYIYTGSIDLGLVVGYVITFFSHEPTYALYIFNIFNHKNQTLICFYMDIITVWTKENWGFSKTILIVWGFWEW